MGWLILIDLEGSGAYASYTLTRNGIKIINGENGCQIIAQQKQENIVIFSDGTGKAGGKKT
ncbi:MAG: hypothetical protein ACI9LU_002152 [Polaribacter sp.]